jgi:hypothetical protein
MLILASIDPVTALVLTLLHALAYLSLRWGR